MIVDLTRGEDVEGWRDIVRVPRPPLLQQRMLRTAGLQARHQPRVDEPLRPAPDPAEMNNVLPCLYDDIRRSWPLNLYLQLRERRPAPSPSGWRQMTDFDIPLVNGSPDSTRSRATRRAAAEGLQTSAAATPTQTHATHETRS